MHDRSGTGAWWKARNATGNESVLDFLGGILGVSRVVLLVRVFYRQAGIPGTLREHGRLATYLSGVPRKLLCGVFGNRRGVGIWCVLDSDWRISLSLVCLFLRDFCLRDGVGSYPWQQSHHEGAIKKAAQLSEFAENEWSGFQDLESPGMRPVCCCRGAVLPFFHRSP